MKRSDFFKSLFGIALIPIAGKLIANESVKKCTLEQQMSLAQWLSNGKDSCINAEAYYNGIPLDKNDFTVNGKEVTKVELIDNKAMVVTWSQDIIPCEIKYIK